MYDAELLDRSAHPRYKGTLTGAAKFPLINASCGDQITIYLCIVDGRIVDGRWQGQGCAISLTSADFFIESVIGKSLSEARQIKAEFTKMILGQPFSPQEVGATQPLQMVSRMPARVNCAKLPWQALDEQG